MTLKYEAKATGPLLSQLDSRGTLNTVFDPILRDSQNNAATFFNLVPQTPSQGDFANWVIRTTRNFSIGSGPELPDIEVGRQGRQKAQTIIKKNYGWVEVSDFEIQAQAKVGISAEAVFTEEVRLVSNDLLSSTLVTSTSRSGVDYQMFRDGTGNSNLNILGLSAWVDDGTNNGGVATIAGITRSSANSFMNAGLINTTTEAISSATLRAMITQAQINGSRLDQLLYVTTPALRASILNLMEPAQRFTTEAKFGFRQLTNLPMFDEIAIYSDRHCESGKIYLLDMSTFARSTLQGMHFTELAKTSASIKGQIAMFEELICRNPNKNYVALNKS